MQNLKVYNLSKDEIYVLMKDVFDNCKVSTWDKSDKTDLHHNSDYRNLLLIIKHGLLSIDASIREGLYKTRQQGVDNVNGRDNISVSMETSVYPGEDYYDHDWATYVNFVISSKIRDVRRVGRNSLNYGNEFLINDSVPVEYFKAIEVRFLNLIKLINESLCNVSIDSYIESYNYFIDCVQYMVDHNIDIPLIEASEEMCVLDKQKLLSYGKMVK